MNSINCEISKQRINPKYESLPGEFKYKNSCWVQWSSLDIIKKMENDFKFYPDDILIATYPKAGTTLLQEIVWMIINNVNIELEQNKPIFMRCPFLDENYKHNFSLLNYEGYIVNGGDFIPRPRFMKTHLNFCNLENQFNKNPEMKVLIVIRNPKDNAVSMYHFYLGIEDYGPFKGTWDEFFERWIDGWIAGGDWLDVTLGWWNERFRKNFKIIFFEDLIYRKKTIINEICVFLNKKLTDDQINKIIEHTEFKNAKVNPNLNYSLMKLEGFRDDFQFMRKGEVGDWKNFFTEEQSRRCDEKYNATLESVGLKFQYE